MAGYSYLKTGKALKGLGNYRVKRAGEVASERNDGLGQHHYLALGMRETLLQNIESYRLDAFGVPEDTGWIQGSRKWAHDALEDMPAVRAGTWKPVVEGKTPLDKGYCPRFEEALQFTDTRFETVMKSARRDGVATGDLPRFAIASHNAGYSGALRGYREGDVDRYTAGGDYSAWVLATAKSIKQWLFLHPGWRV